jgi:hypothetical protein
MSKSFIIFIIASLIILSITVILFIYYLPNPSEDLVWFMKYMLIFGFIFLLLIAVLIILGAYLLLRKTKKLISVLQEKYFNVSYTKNTCFLGLPFINFY